MTLTLDLCRRRVGFTLVELLVALTIIVLLAGVLLPALSSAKSKALSATCLNNKRQLQLAWLLYAADNNDQMPPNGEILPGPPRVDRQYWWAQGIMSYAENHTDNTNVSLLIDPAYARLGSYTRSPQLYKCPADRSTALADGAARPRVRSVSLNVHVGRCIDCIKDRPTHLGPTTTAGIPNPANQFVLLDEHPDSISTIAFWTSPAEGSSAKIVSFPGSQHKGAATLSFADGHAESHRWRDSRTRPPVTGRNELEESASPNNADVAWLQQHTYFAQK